MNKPTEIPDTVRTAINQTFRKEEVPEIISSLRWDGINGNYYMLRWGMYIGIELDGYIHS